MFEIGNSLLEARMRQGLDLPQLELETKVRAKYLRALEEERFDQLPAETYVRGFLRVYAERLGLDPQLYVDEYNSRFASHDEPSIARASSSPRQRRRARRLESHAILVALAGIATVTVLVIAAWKLGGSGEGPAESTPTESGALAAPTVEEPRPETGEEPEPVPVTEPEPAAPTPPAVETAPPEDQPATPAPPEAPRQATLTVEAVRGASTLVVRRGGADGQTVFEGTLEQGQKQQFEAKRLYVEFGSPGNLRIVANGAQVRTKPSRLVVTLGGAREPAGA
ncbi:MAG: DUF4115 domain-containing protein [Thermoleophilia bacterium]